MSLPDKTDAQSYRASDLLVIALWWGLAAGLGEGFLAQSYIWRDLMRAGVEFEPLLFLAVVLVVIVLKRDVFQNSDLMQTTFLFSGLALFACLSRRTGEITPLIVLLVSVAAASLVGLLSFLRGPSMMRWQKRSLPVLLLAALWCIIGFPLRQQLHERRDQARLPSQSHGPNVLVILVDTLRADHLSTYGYSRPTSPHLTQLAAEGTLFENAIAPSSWTLPVHASLLTGLYPAAHHVESDGALFGWRYRTLGEEFMARGYRTAAFSANTLLFCRRRGFRRGFIHFEDDFQSLGSSFAQTFYGDLIKHLLFRLELKRDLFGRRSAADINGHALRWIDSDRRPFFMFLNYLDVHDPYRPPEPYLHRYTNMKDPRSRASEHWNWFEHVTPEQRQGMVDAYDGAINLVDDQIQQLMQQLRQRGLDRNTVVVVTSDHGESFGEHGLMNHASSLYRELIHVPLILWAPGRIPAGRQIETPVSLTSLPATLLEEAGEAQHPEFPQTSLERLWNGAVPGSSVPNPISEVAQLSWNRSFPDYYGPMESITTAHWHYIHGGKFHDELFLCCTDKPEQVNLAGTVIGRSVTAQLNQELASNTSRESWENASDSSQQATLGSTYYVNFQPTHLAIDDFDADGDIDIVVSGINENRIALLLGDGRGEFRQTPELRRILTGFVQRRMSSMRSDDRSKCLRAVSRQTSAVGLAKCTMTSVRLTSPLHARFTDLNRDGFKDVLLSDHNGQTVSWLLANRDGGFHLSEAHRPMQQINTTKESSILLAQGDIDGNGMQDFAIPDALHNSVLFLVAMNKGRFAEAALPSAQHPTAIALADVNHDGRADLVLISHTNKSVTVLPSH